MENNTQAVRILIIRRYLKRISDAIYSPPHMLNSAVNNFTVPSDDQGPFSSFALDMIERTCTKESMLEKLKRLAAVLSQEQLAIVLATIANALEHAEIDEILSMGRCECEPYGGPIQKCERCKVSLCSNCSMSILALCKTISKSAAPNKHIQERFKSLAAKRVYSPCENCLGDAVFFDEIHVDSTGYAKQCECVLSAAGSIIRLSQLSAPVHCRECFTKIVKDMRRPNTKYRHGGIMGEMDLLMYSCDCGNSSSPDTIRICRLCRGICKPYTLNKSNTTFHNHSNLSFELTGGSGRNTGTWRSVGDEWDNDYCPFFFKSQFFMD